MNSSETHPVKGVTNKEVIRTLIHRLRENINSYYPDLDKLNLSITGKSIGGPFAKTFRFDLTSNGIRHIIFVKQCPLYKDNPAKIQYETLQLLYHSMPAVNKRCAVSRPLDFFPDLNAYAMESVGTNNFKTYLLKNNSRLNDEKSLPDLLSVLSGCALWLRTFHNITKSDKGTMFDSSVFLNSIREEFDYILLRDFGFRSDTLNRLNALFNNLSILDGTFALPCAKWHWDYTPGHIYLDYNTISVIDVLGLDNTPIYEDIGHFLVAMTIANNLPFYPFFDRKRARTELCDAFLDAYWDCCRLDKNEFLLFSKIYTLKYLILYFGGQYSRISEKIHPVAGRLFANVRSVVLTEEPMILAIEEIERLMTNAVAARLAGIAS